MGKKIVEDLKKALRKSHQWKLPEITKVPNFWLNAFDCIDRNITNCFNRANKNPEIQSGLHKGLHTCYPNQ